MLTALVCTVYVLVMIAANLLIVAFGPIATPVNAFLLIGLDLALRDWLHLRLRASHMALLIIVTGGLTFALNPAAGQIAIASACAFTAASLADWLVFSRLRGSWMFRANGSNVAGALVDSLLFPTIAFGALIPHIVVMQFFAKIAGGALWSFVIRLISRP